MALVTCPFQSPGFTMYFGFIRAFTLLVDESYHLPMNIGKPYLVNGPIPANPRSFSLAFAKAKVGLMNYSALYTLVLVLYSISCLSIAYWVGGFLGFTFFPDQPKP